MNLERSTLPKRSFRGLRMPAAAVVSGCHAAGVAGRDPIKLIRLCAKFLGIEKAMENHDDQPRLQASTNSQRLQASAVHGALGPVCIVVLLLALAHVTAKADDDMAKIPAGSYVPLYIKEAETRQVKAFYIDRTPVTNGEFLQFVTDNPKWRRSQMKRLFADENYLKHWGGDIDLGPDAEKIRHSPVSNISWFAARAYLKSEGKRLPTEDEWEYVACADETRANAAKDPAFVARLLEWYGKANDPFLSVKEAKPNLYGVSAMHGFVWEWVRDFNNAMVTGESRGDSGVDRALYCAGGALGTADPHNYAAFMRYAFRSSLKGNYTVQNLGFRGARSIETKPEK